MIPFNDEHDASYYKSKRIDWCIIGIWIGMLLGAIVANAVR